MRARNIKPGFYANERLAECSVWARLIFPGLWMLADREGRLEDRPKRIKAQLLPFETVDVEPLLRELESHGFVVRYRNEDGAFIQISKFSEHQSPHYSEKPSAIKPPISENSCSINGVECLEHSGSKSGIKKGSKPPDSLIPDSPNPDSKPPRASRSAPVDEDFVRFWGAYPRKVAKQDALKAWAKARASFSNGDLRHLFDALERAKASEQWRKDGGAFVPHPATWLNGRRWEDEAQPPAAQSSFLGAV